MAKKKSASSRQEKRVRASVLFTTPITEDSAGNCSGSQPVPIRRSTSPMRPKEIRERPTLRWDVSTGRLSSWSAFAWMPTSSLGFAGQGKKYQTYMNAVLRREMQTNARVR